jgi:hypothetical protein
MTTMARKEKTYTVFEVLADTDADGPGGDGVQVFRFKREIEAKDFAKNATCWGNPAKVAKAENVPRRIAERWGMT